METVEQLDTFTGEPPIGSHIFISNSELYFKYRVHLSFGFVHVLIPELEIHTVPFGTISL